MCIFRLRIWCCLSLVYFFFFFKRKTAYEFRISDWSSDVCSSDRVEGRLAEDLRGIAAEPIVVTGLYGGVDWGPTDAWIQTDQPTVVICTFEKADALLRYLGVLFLSRVRTVIIDEAHMVEQDEARLTGLGDGPSRAFRLEQLGTRLMRALEDHDFRIEIGRANVGNPVN